MARTFGWGYGMKSWTIRFPARMIARSLLAVTLLGACATGAESDGVNPLFGDAGGPSGPADAPEDGTTGGSDDGSICETDCKLSDGNSSSGGEGDGDGDGATDGETPDCADGETEPCYTGPQDTRMVGACSDGTRTCTDGIWGECEGQVVPVEETCNGTDDDCNGTPDDAELGGTACSTGELGVCAEGFEACVQGSLICEATNMPTDEVCGNGLDEDCNGTADDGCSTCAHDECTTGAALTSGCSDCATAVCAADAWCCAIEWDSTCVGRVSNLCGLTC